MFLPMFRMVARPSASWAASPGMAPKEGVVPVRGGHHGHLVYSEVLVEYIEGGRRAATTGNGDRGARLVSKGFAPA